LPSNGSASGAATIVRRYEEQAGRAVLERAQGEIAHHGARAADFCRVTQRWATWCRTRARPGRPDPAFVMPVRHGSLNT
jgi:hypothetical protein